MPMSRKRRNSSKKILNRILAILAAVLAILGVCTLYLIYSYSVGQKKLSKTYVNGFGYSKTSNIHESLSILLMGVDTGDSERGGQQSWNGNSDSQIILTMNPKTKTTTLISMQRDTMTNILNEKKSIVSTQKMNAAYPLGYNSGGLNRAASYAMSTISEQCGISINDFVVINMDGLVQLIDDIGGIDIINNSGTDIFISNTEPQYKAVVPFIGEGKYQHINGEQALVYSRDRDHLPNGDYGRSEHQKEVLQQLIKKLLQVDSVFVYQKFINHLSNNFKTNIPIDFKSISDLWKYRDCFEKVISIQYQGIGEMVTDPTGNELSYQFIPRSVYLAVQNSLKKSLGEPTIQDINGNIITYEKYFERSAPLYYLPLATVTERGRTTRFGVNPDGSFSGIERNNCQKYLNCTG